MPDPFDDIDPGADFERYAVGLFPVTVCSVDPGDGSVRTTVEDVPAVKSVKRKWNAAVGGGQLGTATTRFVFRANRLSFELKPLDTITEQGSGTVWVVDEAEFQGFDTLLSVTVTQERTATNG